MDDREITRGPITSKTTVPDGRAAWGTISTDSSDSTLLIVSSGIVQVDFDEFLNKGYRNVWIYLGGSHKVAKVKSIMTISSTSYGIYIDRALPGISSEQFTTVIGDLIGFYIKNNGAADATVDDITLKPDHADNREVVVMNEIPIYKDVITIDGASTSLVVIEIR